MTATSAFPRLNNSSLENHSASWSAIAALAGHWSGSELLESSSLGHLSPPLLPLGKGDGLLLDNPAMAAVPHDVNGITILVPSVPPKAPLENNPEVGTLFTKLCLTGGEA